MRELERLTKTIPGLDVDQRAAVLAVLVLQAWDAGATVEQIVDASPLTVAEVEAVLDGRR